MSSEQHCNNVENCLLKEECPYNVSPKPGHFGESKRVLLVILEQGAIGRTVLGKLDRKSYPT